MLFVSFRTWLGFAGNFDCGLPGLEKLSFAYARRNRFTRSARCHLSLLLVGQTHAHDPDWEGELGVCSKGVDEVCITKFCEVFASGGVTFSWSHNLWHFPQFGVRGTERGC